MAVQLKFLHRHTLYLELEIRNLTPKGVKETSFSISCEALQFIHFLEIWAFQVCHVTYLIPLV